MQPLDAFTKKTMMHKQMLPNLHRDRHGQE
jgi:hypothetical protein